MHTWWVATNTFRHSLKVCFNLCKSERWHMLMYSLYWHGIAMRNGRECRVVYEGTFPFQNKYNQSRMYLLISFVQNHIRGSYNHTQWIWPRRHQPRLLQCTLDLQDTHLRRWWPGWQSWARRKVWSFCYIRFIVLTCTIHKATPASIKVNSIGTAMDLLLGMLPQCHLCETSLDTRLCCRQCYHSFHEIETVATALTPNPTRYCMPFKRFVSFARVSLPLWIV